MDFERRWTPATMFLQLLCLPLMTSESSPVLLAARSFCNSDQYYDGVVDSCVPCSDICRPEIPPDFCFNNCPGFIKRPVASTSTSAHRTTTTTLSSSSSTPLSAETDDVTHTPHNLSSISSSPVVLIILVGLLLVSSVAIILVLVALVIVWCVRKRRRPTREDEPVEFGCCCCYRRVEADSRRISLITKSETTSEKSNPCPEDEPADTWKMKFPLPSVSSDDDPQSTSSDNSGLTLPTEICTSVS